MHDFLEVDTAERPPVPSVENEYSGPSTCTETVLIDVLAYALGIENVPVDGHFFEDLGADSMTMARFCARVRKRDDLPPVSMKNVYQHPTIRRLATALAPAGAADEPGSLASGFGEELAGVLRVETVPVDGHFSRGSGADSMVMAQFCARVRKRADLPSVSMKDFYRHPTIAGLATALADPVSTPVGTRSPLSRLRLQLPPM